MKIAVLHAGGKWKWCGRKSHPHHGLSQESCVSIMLLRDRYTILLLKLTLTSFIWSTYKLLMLISPPAPTLLFFFFPSIIRWQPHIRRVRNTVQTQQRLRVLDGVSCCHGDHCPSLVSLTVKPILLYVVVQASTTHSPRPPALSRLLPSSAEKRTHKQTAAPGWCTNSST